jgi:hypothetical protein
LLINHLQTLHGGPKKAWVTRGITIAGCTGFRSGATDSGSAKEAKKAKERLSRGQTGALRTESVLQLRGAGECRDWITEGAAILEFEAGLNRETANLYAFELVSPIC